MKEIFGRQGGTSRAPEVGVYTWSFSKPKSQSQSWNPLALNPTTDYQTVMLTFLDEIKSNIKLSNWYNLILVLLRNINIMFRKWNKIPGNQMAYCLPRRDALQRYIIGSPFRQSILLFLHIIINWWNYSQSKPRLLLLAIRHSACIAKIKKSFWASEKK
jgi:hypothetical protein